MSWSVPKLWPGQTVVILASGPSMNQTVADQVRHLPCIAVNTTYRLAPWAAMLYAHDRAWWMSNSEALKFPGLKVGGEPAPGVLTLMKSGIIGFDPDPRYMRVGGNSGYQALHLALHSGARRVLLLGFDMQGGHWHEKHPSPLSNPEEGAYLRWAPRFATLTLAVAERGVEVINCTPGSLIDCFPMMSLEAALARIEPDQVAA